MTVPLTFAALAAGLFVLFWGGTLAVQGYLYQQPADRLPIRAAAAAALVAGFLTFWVWLDRRAPGRYDTFFEFAQYTTTPFAEFEAVRWRADPAGKGFQPGPDGKPAERTTAFRRRPGGKGAAFADEAGQPFQLSTSDELTAALLVKTGDGPPARFAAELKDEPRTGRGTYFGEKRFVDPDGRYVRGDQLGVVYVPSGSVVVVALLLNALLYVVWFVAFWPALRFELWHAVGLAAGCGLMTMLVVMPLLFKPNRAPRPPAEVTATPPPPSDVPHTDLSPKSCPGREFGCNSRPPAPPLPGHGRDPNPWPRHRFRHGVS